MIQDELLKQLNIPLPNDGLLKAAENFRKQCLPMDFSVSVQAVEKFKQQLGILDKNALRDITEAHRRMMSMLNTQQFKRLRSLADMTRSWLQKAPSSYNHAPLSETGELCAAVDALIEKAESQGIKEDALPDEKTMRDVFFIVAFYATILTPEAINDWLYHVYESLKIQIHEAVNAAGGVVVSGVFNILALLGLCLQLACYLK